MKVIIEIDCQREWAYEDVMRVMAQIKKIDGAIELWGSVIGRTSIDDGEYLQRFKIT